VRLCPALFVLVAACGDNAEPIAPEVTDPVAFVDPRIGTGGLGFAHGSCFVGAAMPHGLVKLGPDTSGPFGTVNFLHYSGYFAEDDKIQGFSHVHLHGAGATDYGVLSPPTAGRSGGAC
jgi:putative alpha-1,2-mannosidase